MIKQNKKAMTAEALMKILLWIVFAAIIFLGLRYMMQKFGVI
ncbi:MAG: hypothetical protein V1660_01555 [archaeon]